MITFTYIFSPEFDLKKKKAQSANKKFDWLIDLLKLYKNNISF